MAQSAPATAQTIEAYVGETMDAAELSRNVGKALAVITDVTRREQVQRLVGSAVQTYERIAT